MVSEASPLDVSPSLLNVCARSMPCTGYDDADDDDETRIKPDPGLLLQRARGIIVVSET